MAENDGGKKKDSGAVGIKETLTSLLIALMLAFMFRGFVVEGFRIPTGSMAPTLLGAHVRVKNQYTGYDWPVGPWHYTGRGNRGQPLSTQPELRVDDPITAMRITETNRRLAAGDRVFVLKYLPLLQEPRRWDVVVFKHPGTHENYIKRLIGLPGEQLAIVDGDVFARPFIEGKTALSGWEAWTQEDWRIQRKPERVQRAMFQDLFDSRYASDEPTYRSPLKAMTPGWEGVRSKRVYRYADAGPTALAWSGVRPITDAAPYNQTSMAYDLFAAPGQRGNGRFAHYPVSDISMTLHIEPENTVVVRPTIETRGLVFRASVDTATGAAGVEMRDAAAPDGPWTQLDAGVFATHGGIHRIEFWHVDQALWLFVDGQLVAGGPEEGAYAMTPARRASAATGLGWDELRDDPRGGDGRRALGVFARPETYNEPEVRWEFQGGAFTLTNVQLQRDIAYHINLIRPTRGAHPENFPTMGPEHFFMAGDNSANSLDSRLWGDDEIEPWVRQEIVDTPGMVHRHLIVGRAFVVYFPAPLDDGPILTPDFGRVRWIW